MPLNCSTFVTQKEQLKCQAARDQYKGRGFSIGLGLKGLPAGFSSGRTFTRPLK